ncbi:MAG: FecR domain-containing protein [Acidobacteria bacterium]|nr:FecR domain-containing protein [Acidobacteriota bacterium]
MTITTFLARLRYGAGLALIAWLALPAIGQAQGGPADASYASYGDPSAPGEGYATGYSYFKEVEGASTLFPADGSENQDAEINRPVLTGDRVYTTPQARLEILLSDNNVLRLDGDTEVVFESLAYSPESGDTVTTLRLLQGNLQLVTFAGSAGEEVPRVLTGNATVFAQEAGSYRVTAGRQEWTSVVVRAGYAEVASGSGSVVARGGDEVSVEGLARPRVEVVAASSLDGLERWGQDLERGLRTDSYVDDSLRYAASDLDDYGSWVRVEDRVAWRPRAADDWRPYWKGRWVYTPAGMTWVSYEPWGWVPYHYGTWDYSPVYGWLWYPGSRFAPAYVTWYWGDGYAAWVPSGYYVNFYSRHYGARFGLGFGVFGWAGGHWDPFYNWTFCRIGDLGRRHQYDYLSTGRALHGRVGWREVPRGIITTDTRGLTPRRWHDRREVEEVLIDRGGRGGANLPDVTSYVAREPELPRDVRRRVADPVPTADERTRRAANTVRTTDRPRGAGAAGSDLGTLGELGRRNTASNRPVNGESSRSTTSRGTVSSSSNRETARADAGSRPTAVTPRSSDRARNGETNRSGSVDRSTPRSAATTPGSPSSTRTANEGRRPTTVTPRTTPAYPDRGRTNGRSSEGSAAPRGSTRSTDVGRNGSASSGTTDRGRSAERAAPRAVPPSQPRGSSTSAGNSDRGRTATSARPSTSRPPATSSRSTAPESRSTTSSRSSSRPVERAAPRSGTTTRSSASASNDSSSSRSRSSARASESSRSSSRADSSASSSSGSGGESKSSTRSSSSSRRTSGSAKQSSSSKSGSRGSDRTRGQNGGGGG